MRRREREHRADALEALPVRIFRQAGRVVRVEGHAEQVADRVRVFLARELAERDPLAARRLPRRLGLVKLAGDPLRDARDVVRLGPRLSLRRHVAGVDPVHDLLPVPHDLRRIEIDRQRVDPQIALLLFLAVALLQCSAKNGFTTTSRLLGAVCTAACAAVVKKRKKKKTIKCYGVPFLLCVQKEQKPRSTRTVVTKPA